MRIEQIGEGKTIDEAVEIACGILKKDRYDVNIQILNLPKKSFFGKIKILAKVLISYEESDKISIENISKNSSIKYDFNIDNIDPIIDEKIQIKQQKKINNNVEFEKEEKIENKIEFEKEEKIENKIEVEKQEKIENKIEVEKEEKIELNLQKDIIIENIDSNESIEQQDIEQYNLLIDEKIEIFKSNLSNIMTHMGYEKFSFTTKKKEKNIVIINIDSEENMGFLIGKRGETIDSLQFLISLISNRESENFVKFIINCGNYRKKREETLKDLAIKISKTVKKNKKKIMLEPMHSYERRIIHSVISNIDGVFSKSIGDEPNRKVIILLNKKN